MSPATPPPPATSTRQLVVLLAVLAAVRVFIFSAAFPFFSAVDEQMHIDLALHYSHADIPRRLTPPDTNALPFFGLYGSPEYLKDGAPVAPLWKQPVESVREKIDGKMAAYRQYFRNDEASQPPLYYSLAGAWWRLGELLGLHDLPLLYWLRFLNVPLIFALVWLGGVAARKIFPENHFLQVAVPALLAFLPQMMFYAVNNDNLSPLTAAAVFVLLLKFLAPGLPGVRLAAATGLAFAALFLTKLSNLPLLALAGLFLAVKSFRLLRGPQQYAALVPLLVLFLCAAVPMGAWMTWCDFNFGDPTGAAAKIRFLNWGDKPVSAWLPHPMFTPHGFWFFLKTNLATFWQGEQLWHGHPLINPALDLAYVILTLVLLAVALAALLHPRSGFPPARRRVLATCFACVVAMFAFFVLLSMKYDFRDCFYPSRESPFFTSGRLMLGMLLPFLLLFAVGLDRLLKNLPLSIKYGVLALLLAGMLAGEITKNWSVFASQYNWFHQ